MTPTGRNDPCPCGSGRKYKKCCLLQHEHLEQVRRDEESAVQRALNWLGQKFPEELSVALDEYFEVLESSERERLKAFPEHIQGVLAINSGEWLIADGELTVRGDQRRVLDLLLGAGGPAFSVAGRQWLAALAENGISLYEVREVVPDEGVRVVDLLAGKENLVWVVERTASRALVKWDLVGGRLAEQNGHTVFSGAIYLIEREQLNACQQSAKKLRRRKSLSPWQLRRQIGLAVIDTWLAQLVAEPQIPQFVDADSGEPIMLVTDHYRVTDWARLEARLEAQPDVDGDRDDGWVRVANPDENPARPLAGLNVAGADRLEVFAKSIKRADETRTWVERLAGDAVLYRLREVVDPRSPKVRQAAASRPKKSSEIPPEVEVKLMAEMLRRHYSNWIDMPLPALGNKTPRQAVRSAVGRQAVTEILKEFEQKEARRAQDTGQIPYDFRHLWQSLGLRP